MKKYLLIHFIVFAFLSGCGKDENQKSKSEGNTGNKTNAGQSSVKDDVSQKDIAKIAVGSPDHTALVAALQAAGLADVLSNSGPFTVFAPTNAAFSKIPKETLDELMKPENKSRLAKILQHHVAVAVYGEDLIKDGQVLNMVDGTNVTFTKKDGAVYIDKSKITGSVRASNGIVYIVDEVILPASK
ncbi:MAG: fasciclin domain-containing protein [Ignavibacteria bacterium]|nr:fasciclin domain-containing protein [Ignavibacteria bacterium]